MAKIVSFIIQKGGCGKTTTTVNIGAYLALKGFKTLMLDMDPQGNMSQHFGVNPEECPITIRQVLKRECKIEDAIINRSLNLDVIPNNILTAADELSFLSAISREYLLRDQLLKINANYDYILIDCPPSLGILSLNALCASHEMLIVISPDFFPLMAVQPLLETYSIIQEKLNKTLKVKGIAITMYDNRTNHARQVIDVLEKNFPDKIYSTFIRQNVALKDASGLGKSIFEYDPQSYGAEDYAALAEEFVYDHLNNQKKRSYYDRLFESLSDLEKDDVLKNSQILLSSFVKERIESKIKSENIERAVLNARNKILEKKYQNIERQS
jgi:chromosome partitioning protein